MPEEIFGRDRDVDVDPESPLAEASQVSVPWARMFAISRTQASRILPALVLTLFSAFSDVSTPFLFGGVIDVVSTGKEPSWLHVARRLLLGREDPLPAESALALIVFLAILTFLISMVASGIATYLFATAGALIVRHMQWTLFANVVSQEVGFFDRSRTGELWSRISTDTKKLEFLLTTQVSVMLYLLISIVLPLTFLLLVSSRLTLLLMGVVPVVALVGLLGARRIGAISKQLQDATARTSEIVNEVLSSIRTVRSFGREDNEVLRFRDILDVWYAVFRRYSRFNGVLSAIISFLASCLITGVLWYGATLVLNGDLSPGQLTSFIVYSVTVAAAFAGAGALVIETYAAAGATQRVFHLMDRSSEIPNRGGVVPSKAFQGNVEFRKVNFAYPSRLDHSVLRNLSLTIRPGQTVAVVGQSGGGKSTLVKLLMRFYAVQSGTILLDGNAIHTLDATWVRRSMAYVDQEPVLFAVSIRDNIRYGKPDATEAEVESAAREANAHDFITGFPQGYDTMVGERGVRLSGGQKQRVAIARAIIAQPTFLLLDEATSALDAESEHLVQEALDRVMQGRTTVVIAHRLSTVESADLVAVIADGKVAEQGKHAELLKIKHGVYAQLVARQLTPAPAPLPTKR